MRLSFNYSLVVVLVVVQALRSPVVVDCYCFLHLVFALEVGGLRIS